VHCFPIWIVSCEEVSLGYERKVKTDRARTFARFIKLVRENKFIHYPMKPGSCMRVFESVDPDEFAHWDEDGCLACREQVRGTKEKEKDAYLYR
jgi:hypothetical protein